jgi:hypothetical protein
MGSVYVPLLIEARQTLGLSQKDLANMLGSSLRTVERMHAGRSHPSRDHWGLLIRALHPNDPELAARIAAFCNGTLEQFGIAPPTPPPSAPQAPPAAPVPAAMSAHAVESVLFAAAAATDLPLSSVKAILVAALVRARELGVDVETMAEALVGEKD